MLDCHLVAEIQVFRRVRAICDPLTIICIMYYRIFSYLLYYYIIHKNASYNSAFSNLGRIGWSLDTWIGFQNDYRPGGRVRLVVSIVNLATSSFMLWFPPSRMMKVLS